MLIKKVVYLTAIIFLFAATNVFAVRYTVKVTSKDLGAVMKQKEPKLYHYIKTANEDIKQLRQQMKGIPEHSALWRAGRAFEKTLRENRGKVAGPKWKGIVGTTLTVIGTERDDPYRVMRKLISQMVDGFHQSLKRGHAHACFVGTDWKFGSSIPKGCGGSSSASGPISGGSPLVPCRCANGLAPLPGGYCADGSIPGPPGCF